MKTATRLMQKRSVEPHPALKIGDGERVDLPITGMTCAACARRIERKLSKAPGVTRANVNFATSRATVEYDPQATGAGQLIESVKEAGYGDDGHSASRLYH